MTSGSPTGMPDTADIARSAMLRMAQSEQARGLIYHAIHTYNHLLDQYPRTIESKRAAEEMIGLAQLMEQQGKYHTALSLYERLERLP